jgi:hypothetical protein
MGIIRKDTYSRPRGGQRRRNWYKGNSRIKGWCNIHYKKRSGGNWSLKSE